MTATPPRIDAASLLGGMFEGLPAGYAFLDGELRLISLNDAMAVQLGTTRERALGRRIDEVAPHRSGLTGVLCDVVRAGRRELDVPEEAGGRFWTINAFPIETPEGDRCAALVVRDVTAERTATQDLARERAILGQVIEQVPVGIAVLWGEELRYVAVNPGSLAMLPPDLELLDRPLEEALGSYPSVLAQAREIYDGVMASRETLHVDALPVAFADEAAFEGSRYYDVTFTPILLGDRPGGVLTVYVEVTEQVRERTELERALADEHAAATGLARSLLPRRLPDLPGLEVAARYQPAAAEHVVGGDLYDAMAWHDGAALLVLGDIQGKGLAAAGSLALVRHTLRTAALYERSLTAILLRLNEVLLRDADTSDDLTAPRCTVALAALAPPGADGARTLRVALAGHPLPMLLRAGGAVEPAGARGTMLGVVDDPRFDEVDVELTGGDTLVLYTDGLSDAHAPVHFNSEARIAAQLEACTGLPPARVLDCLCDALVGRGEQRDDLALLAARVVTR
ncbi:MAG: SpoIIE family protein phosphatase [Actinomycetota bacterium]|nr:SpoIIE family protein phosphatase [Actinomycetota bacterium]